MDDRNYLSKDTIRQKMFQHAASSLGIHSVEELDPLVLLLIEGLSSELYTIGQELHDSHLRILEKVAGQLTPSAMIFPKPAHAIAKMDVHEPAYFINRHTELQAKNLSQELLGNDIDVLAFVPVTDIRLIQAKINYLICERKLYKTNGFESKNLIAQAEIVDERVNYTVWIGLQVNEEVENLKNTSFYLDFSQTDKKYEKYTLLPYTRWSHVGENIEMESGLPVWNKESSTYSIFDKYGLLHQVDKYILELYHIQFLTIKNDLYISHLKHERLPSEISDIFPEKAVEKMAPSIWIKVTVPPHILANDLYNMTVHLNAFPVANKIPFSIINHIQGDNGIIPLRTRNHQYFLSIETVNDSYGHEYKQIPYASDQSKETGVYTLKRSGMERFDVRDAKTYMERIVDLLRSEKTAFSSVEMDSLRNIVNRLGENLRDIEAAYEKIKIKGWEDPYYLLMNTFHKDERVYIDYWGTNCEWANGLRTGKILPPVNSLPIENDSCRLLKMTSGGKSAPTSIQKLDTYRYAIGSHDLIITNENIVNYLRMELADKVTRIEVKKGVGVSPKAKEGLIRTTDIFLTATPGFHDILRQMEPELLTLLHHKSPDIFNYRIFLNETPYNT
jgi:hypothetical protein